MLIRRHILERIKTGDISLAFRRWKRPTVKTGGTLKTSIGLLAFESVTIVEPEDITNLDARRAGYADADSVIADLAERDGDVYRIAVAYAGEDPRVALRQDDRLSDSDVDAIRKRLDRLDRGSDRGPWTRRVLEALRDHPHVPAVEIGRMLGYERAWLKPNIRKLKAMGLTVSYRPGYTLSPRGLALLERLG